MIFSIGSSNFPVRKNCHGVFREPKRHQQDIQVVRRLEAQDADGPASVFVTMTEDTVDTVYSNQYLAHCVQILQRRGLRLCSHSTPPEFLIPGYWGQEVFCTRREDQLATQPDQPLVVAELEKTGLAVVDDASCSNSRVEKRKGVVFIHHFFYRRGAEELWLLTVMTENVVHRRGRFIAILLGIEKSHGPAGSPERHGGRQAGRAAADDKSIEKLCLRHT